MHSKRIYKELVSILFLIGFSCLCIYVSINQALGAPVNIYGFEYQTIQQESCINGGTSTGTVSISTSVKRTGTASFNANPAGAALANMRIYVTTGADGIINTTGLSSAYTRIYVYFTAFPATNPEEFLLFADSGTGRKSEYRISSAGIITGHNAAGTLVGTAGTAVSLNTWTKLDILSSAGTATQQLKINDVSQFSVSSNQGAATTAIIFLGKAININSEGFNVYMDDIAIDSAAYPPGGGQQVLVPNSAGSNNDYTSGTGASNYTQCLEVPTDNLTTYVRKSAASSQSFLFAMQDCSDKSISGSIYGVKAFNSVSEFSDVTSATGIRVRSNATDSDSTTSNTTQAGFFSCLQRILSVDPGTTLAFTCTDIDQVQVGSFDTSANTQPISSSTYMLVDFATPTPTPTPTNTPTPVPGTGTLLLLGVGK